MIQLTLLVALTTITTSVVPVDATRKAYPRPSTMPHTPALQAIGESASYFPRARLEAAMPVSYDDGFHSSIRELLIIEGEDRAKAVRRAMDSFRTKLPESQGMNEMNGLGVNDIQGKTYPDTHLNGIATRLGVSTKAECRALLIYLKDPDPKMRRIAAFALRGVVKAFPNGMSSSDIQDVDSEGHRNMVKTFMAGIEKLPK